MPHPNVAPFRRRFVAHRLITIVGGATLLALAVWAFVPEQSSTPAKGYNLIVSSCGFAALAVAAHLIAEFWLIRGRQPNWDEIDRTRAEGRAIEEERGRVLLHRRHRLVWVALLPLLVAVPLPLVAFAAVPPGGWPANPDLRLDRGVGPGDWAVVDANTQLRSIHGDYFYEGRVEHINPEQCGHHFHFLVDAEERGHTRHALYRNNAKFPDLEPARVQLKLRTPPDEKLYDQTIRVRITAEIQYPVWHDENTFELRHTSVVREATIRTVPRAATERYRRAVRLVTPLAAAMYLLGAVGFTVANRRHINHHSVGVRGSPRPRR